ncbi:hypothetical protein [Fulvivirga ligni]|uniref:hypothetical protein n=1 Tax=Fulvivirga ligni TaxID=2904246 RepID=UPI001F47091C|nr:hypothetical protein [Fulvivirga ligni]UII23537.1 hypothetical protein LVD16_09885 [Fulvivirga ligni]
MKKLILISLLLLTQLIKTSAQNIVEFGARSTGMGYTSSTMADEWSLLNNPAGLSELKNMSVIGGFENRYGVEGLNTIAAGINKPLTTGSIGISVLKFGDDLYHEQQLSASYANTFGITSLGIRVNYNQYHLEGYGNKNLLSIDFGGITTLSEQFIIGAYIKNINQAKISDFEDERLPTIMQVGISYRPTQKVIFNVEVEKDLDYDLSIQSGLEYLFLSRLAIRIGAQTNAFKQFAGLGFRSRKLSIDYAITNSRNLGLSHQVGLIYYLKLAE